MRAHLFLSRFSLCFPGGLAGTTEGSQVVDLSAVPGRPFVALGLLTAPDAIVLWQVRKLQATLVLPLPAHLPRFTSLAVCAPHAAVGGLDFKIDLESIETPPLPHECSAWSTLSVDTPARDVRAVASLVLGNPAGCGDSCASSALMSLALVGGGKRPGQAHLVGHAPANAGATAAAEGPLAPTAAAAAASIAASTTASTGSNNFQRRSVAGVGACLLSMEPGGVLRCSDGDAAVLATLGSLAGAQCSVSVHPAMPLIACYTTEGTVSVLLAKGKCKEAPPGTYCEGTTEAEVGSQ